MIERIAFAMEQLIEDEDNLHRIIIICDLLWSLFEIFLEETMIYFSLISRLKDGLPLVSTTDATLLECGNPDMQEGYKQLKVLSRKAYSFPDRCSYEFGKYSVR